MPSIRYQAEYPYLLDGSRFYPGFWVTLSSATEEVRTVAWLDSGAELSLFDGTLAQVLGLDLMSGRRRMFGATTGALVTAYVHPIQLLVEQQEPLTLDIAFSSGPIQRNLLGRDFFYEFKIGFEERFSVVRMVRET